MTILLTAFDPFGGEKVNPAGQAVDRMSDCIGPVRVIKLTVPTVFVDSIACVESAIKQFHPEVVVCVGQAGGRTGITPERVAINVSDASIPDNAGAQPIDQPVFSDGAAAYFSTLPVKAMVQKMRQGGYPAALSNSAGTFVCNHLMYGVLYLIDRRYPGIRAGFIHVPYSTGQAAGHSGVPSMSIEDIAAALTLALTAITEDNTDIIVAQGGLC